MLVYDRYPFAVKGMNKHGFNKSNPIRLMNHRAPPRSLALEGLSALLPLDDYLRLETYS
ncbi:hypothetical protein SAMN05443377_103143 [Propionibacterium cyclohexanicum]|uniref:Uncharacterized protein n=1 Tax=Propionibacterium cyclohexanicum TaxID=64702 RepID=A0A1H9QIT1_9ACTN|nr:hypothetical protein SAMN05443377_103143 [Propionibacterium cyclohexanicum]